ncbi:toll/interleukin-1 receptor domain-containing protein [Spirillospora sp. NPDC047279]|uniref:toll/interleukin-1 receptor domain-containing protein n=1 Tax=Spirillospora sp. NPDC047279 TaxID=3155478 RepID=UPI0033F405A7
MNEVFVNYRTGDGDEAAALLENALSARFGTDAVFRAAKSIPPGTSFQQALLTGVRRCSVLLAVIGAGWSGDRRLHDVNDWVRREIIEARDCGIPVIPVLKGRTSERLRAEDLPDELAWLADVQSLRLDTRDNGSHLRRIGDELMDLVPSLSEVGAPAPGDDGQTRNSAENVHGTVVQGRDFTGDVGGTVINGNHGPVHTGKGSIYQGSQHFSGDGTTYVQGAGSSREDER